MNGVLPAPPGSGQSGCGAIMAAAARPKTAPTRKSAVNASSPCELTKSRNRPSMIAKTAPTMPANMVQ